MQTEQVVADILKFLRASGWDLSGSKADFLSRAISSEFKKIFGGGRNDRCRVCREVLTGQVVTISPRGKAFFVFPVCMKHIQDIEEWIEGKRRRFSKPDVDPRQTTFADLSGALVENGKNAY